MFVGDNNLAINKRAWQISVFAEGVASRAVDGNLNPDYGNESCTHTNVIHIKPWLTVDLEQMYLIEKVTITNRADCCGECFYCGMYVPLSDDLPDTAHFAHWKSKTMSKTIFSDKKTFFLDFFSD